MQVTLLADEIEAAIDVGVKQAAWARSKKLRAHGGFSDAHYAWARINHVQAALAECAFAKGYSLPWRYELGVQRDYRGLARADYDIPTCGHVEIRSRRTSEGVYLGVKDKDQDHFKVVVMANCTHPPDMWLRHYRRACGGGQLGHVRAFWNAIVLRCKYMVWKSCGWLYAREARQDQWRNPQYTGGKHEYTHIVPCVADGWEYRPLHSPYLLIDRDLSTYDNFKNY